MTPIQQKLVSGKSITLSTFFPLVSQAQPNIVLLSDVSGTLTNFISSGIVKPTFTKTVYAQRIISVEGRPERIPNNGSVEASTLKKEGGIRNLLVNYPTGEHGGIVFDMTSHALLANEKYRQLPVVQRKANVIKTFLANTPPESAKNGMTVFFVVLPKMEDGVKVTMSSVNRLTTFSEFIIFSLIENSLQLKANSVFVVTDSRFKRMVRIDPNDKLTDTPAKRINALIRFENLVNGDVEEPQNVISKENKLEKQIRQDANDITNPEANITVDMMMNVIDDLIPKEIPMTPAEKLAKERFETRKRELSEQQAKAVFYGHRGKKFTLEEILKPIPAPKIVSKQAPGMFINPATSKPKFDSISRSYIESLYDRDMAAVFTSLSKDPVSPMFIQSFTRVDSSDSLNTKETVSVQYKGADGKSTTIHVDVPILSRDDYMRLNGNKYSITKQIMAMPIIKVRPSEVLITTAYNKATLERFGQNASAASSYIRLLAGRISKESTPGVKVEIGSAVAANTKFKSSIEYDDIARTVRSIRVKNGAFIFSRPALERELVKVAPWFPLNDGAKEHPVGFLEDGNVVITLSPSGLLSKYKKNVKGIERDPEALLQQVIYDEVVKATTEDAGKSLPKPSVPQRKYMYSRVKMLSQYLPTAVIIGYTIGLTEMLRKADISFHVVTAETYRRSQHSGKDAIVFSDAVIVFNPEKIRDSLLMNGLKELDTEDIALSEFGPKGTGWVDHIADRLGGPGHAKALINYQTSFIDPMTESLLADLNLPTDMAGVLLYANNLLEDNQYSDPNDITSYRLRGPELINTLLYKTLHREMERVRATRESASPQKLMVNQTDVMRQIQGASNVEEVSELNPLLEVELRGKATWTGAAGGLGDGRTVTRGMRAFHKSMHGVFGYYSPDSSEIGVKRSLTFATLIDDSRGRFSKDEKPNTAEKTLAFGELITPFVSAHADSPRIGMQSKQATHTMPVLKHTPLLFGSGAEKALATATGNTFTYKAMLDGKVEKIDEKNSFVKLIYTDGSVAYIDLTPRSAKNSGGGFYITNQLTLNPGVKEGFKFKAGTVLAHDPSFFSPMPDGSTAYKSGILTRIAITPLDQTYEDSLMITSKLVEDTVSRVTLSRSVSLNAKANLQSTVKVGDTVKPNDALAVFENITDDGDISTLLQRVGSEFESSIAELTRNVATAKYLGRVVEIRTYYNRDIEELSPSLQKFIKQQTAIADKRLKLCQDMPVDEPVRANMPIRIQRDKVGGETVDGVLIIFLIQVDHRSAPGDKYVTASPLKGIVSRVLEEGEEPFDESGKQIDYVLSPLSINSRMTLDAFLGAWSNAILVDLKSEVLKIYNED